MHDFNIYSIHPSPPFSCLLTSSVFLRFNLGHQSFILLILGATRAELWNWWFWLVAPVEGFRCWRIQLFLATSAPLQNILRVANVLKYSISNQEIQNVQQHKIHKQKIQYNMCCWPPTAAQCKRAKCWPVLAEETPHYTESPASSAHPHLQLRNIFVKIAKYICPNW